MKVLSDLKEAQELFYVSRQSGGSVGLVPTMGALHRGHISLVEAAKAMCDCVAVSIFVNAIQFSDAGDHLRYPRSLESDLTMLDEAGVDVVLTPSDDEMHPKPMRFKMVASVEGDRLEGLSRPGHFDGVATVVAKLFSILGPGVAFFGEKDFQQLSVVRRMAHEFHFPVKIIGCPTVREADGLAMSSRNRLLTPEMRRSATVLYRAMVAAQERFAAGQVARDRLVDAMLGVLSSEPSVIVDYASVVDPQTLDEVAVVEPTSRLVVAAQLGSVRLIDNAAVSGK